MNVKTRRTQEEAKEAKMSRKELGLDEGVGKLKAVIQCKQKDQQALDSVVQWFECCVHV